MPARDDRPDVLSNLPRSRPQRRSAKRDAPARPTAARRPQRPVAPPPPEPPRSIEPPSGAELLSSAAKAAGEIAALGIAVGREAVRAALSRIPRP